MDASRHFRSRAHAIAASVAVACAVLLGPVRASTQPARRGPHVHARPLAAGMVRVPGGAFRPFYRAPGDGLVRVATFDLDEHAVTNAEYLAFVGAHPEWRRSRVPRLFADEGYLAQWRGDLDAGTSPNQPVTRVSWFAAKAYCESHGKRLPRESEWEYAARASERAADGSRDRAMVQRVMQFYARPQPTTIPDVRTTYRNYYGLWDMHGLVWEWVLDFNATRELSDNRNPETAEDNRFCGASALGANDRADYATFMRFAFRSSLSGDYTVRNLGFRCAMDVE